SLVVCQPGPRRLRHSFPTRRSSDLDVAAQAPSLGSPELGQAHALAAGGLASGAPELASPELGQRHALGAVSLAAGEPILGAPERSEEHTSELQSRENLVCRLLLEKK